jgi:hypothetical protein
VPPTSGRALARSGPLVDLCHELAEGGDLQRGLDNYRYTVYGSSGVDAVAIALSQRSGTSRDRGEGRSE